MPIERIAPRRRVGKYGGYGWKPSLPSYRKPWLYAATNLPVSAAYDLCSLKNESGEPLMPPVYNQGDAGSCTGNSSAGAVQYLRRVEGLPDFVPSRLFIYWNARGYEGDQDYDGGAQIHDAVEAIVQYGAPPETDWPYDTTMVTTQPDEAAFTAGKLDLAIEYKSLNQGLPTFRAILGSGLPIVFGFTVYESFESDLTAETGVMTMPTEDEQIVGGHAVLMVGYDDSKSAVKVRNSWGPGWGDQGYFWMPYDYVGNPALASDFWVIQKMEGATA